MIHKHLSQAIALAGLSLFATQGFGAISWSPDGISTLFQDDDIDAVYSYDAATGTLTPKVLTPGAGTTPPYGPGNLPIATIEEGDVLIAVFELPEANGIDILPQELTGISVIQVASLPTGDPTTDPIIFQPFELGMNNAINQVVGGGFSLGSTGDLGGGAMLAMYLDNSPDLVIDAGAVGAGTVSCPTGLAQCIDQASNGQLWQVDGFGDDPDVYWEATLEQDQFVDLQNILNAQLTTDVGSFDAGLDILVNNTGRILAENAYIAQGGANAGTGLVDMIVAGPLKGGGARNVLNNTFDNGVAQYGGWLSSGIVATSDIDLEKTSIGVPAPATLALLGIGVLGLRLAGRRKR